MNLGGSIISQGELGPYSLEGGANTQALKSRRRSYTPLILGTLGIKTPE